MSRAIGTMTARWSYLVDDVDAIVNLLPSENRMEIVEPVLQVVFPVTEWNDDSYL